MRSDKDLFVSIFIQLISNDEERFLSRSNLLLTRSNFPTLLERFAKGLNVSFVNKQFR